MGIKKIKNGLDTILYDEMVNNFFNGSYTEGQKLDPTAISEQYGVSKTPVTQVLKRMNHEGLIICSDTGKYFIPTCTEKEVNDICDVRLMLEKEAIKNVLETETEKKIELLKKIAKKGEEFVGENDILGSIKNDLEFHLCLIQLCNNEWLTQIYTLVRNKLVAFNYVSNYKYNLQQGAVQEHYQLLDAINNKDAQRAIAILKKHIDDIRFPLINHSKKVISEK